ncbi:MAG: ATP-dependent RNA helicase DeaD [Cellvibrionaceae bacterium]|jgi:ATP-dependent RNA helicase DeaD
MTNEQTEADINGDKVADYPELKIDELPEFIQVALENAGWTSLSPVQSATLLSSIEGQDMMVQAKTGSGKTGAFILPLIEKIDPIEPECQAIVLVPTRELAVQVVKEAEMLLEGLEINVIPVYGGTRYDKQLKAFKKGAHLVVGTPGRVLDHLASGNLSLDLLTTLIFDEADRMLSMGFYQDMLSLRGYLPEHEVHTAMFSATFPATVRSLASQFQKNAKFVNLSTDQIAADDVTHIAYVVESSEKDRTLVRLLEIEQPQAAIIFCNTRQRVNYVNTVLSRMGFDSDYLTSDLPQHARERVLDRVRDGKLKILVATDVAARGIDIPHLTHAIQFELPEDLEIYIHRAGRTGRAGAKGTAYSIVAGFDEVQMHKLTRSFKVEFEKQPAPTEEDVSAAISGKLVAKLNQLKETRDRLEFERSARILPFVKNLSEDDESARLVALILDDYMNGSLMSNTVEAKPDAKPAAEVEQSRGSNDSSEASPKKPSQRNRRSSSSGGRKNDRGRGGDRKSRESKDKNNEKGKEGKDKKSSAKKPSSSSKRNDGSNRNKKD